MDTSNLNKKFVIDTNRAPRAIGPYSQAVGYNGLVFLSGQIAMDPDTGEIVPGGVEVQTRRVMDNLQAVLMAAGLDFSHVLKTTIFLRNMNDFALVNEVYSLYFDSTPPARATVEVSRLPKDVLVEVDMIAAAPTDYVELTREETEEDVVEDAQDELENDETPGDDDESENSKEAEESGETSEPESEKPNPPSISEIKIPSPSELSEASEVEGS